MAILCWAEVILAGIVLLVYFTFVLQPPVSMTVFGILVGPAGEASPVIAYPRENQEMVFDTHTKALLYL